MSEDRAVMWMLTSGRYSDLRDLGIYTDKAEADRAAELANLGRDAYEDECFVEEVAVLDGIMPRRAEIISIIGRPLEWDAETEEYPRGAQLLLGQQDVAPYISFDGPTGRLHVEGESEAARKAYAEHAARIKADTEGNTQ